MSETPDKQEMIPELRRLMLYEDQFLINSILRLMGGLSPVLWSSFLAGLFGREIQTFLSYHSLFYKNSYYQNLWNHPELDPAIVDLFVRRDYQTFGREQNFQARAEIFFKRWQFLASGSALQVLKTADPKAGLRDDQLVLLSLLNNSDWDTYLGEMELDFMENVLFRIPGEKLRFLFEISSVFLRNYFTLVDCFAPAEARERFNGEFEYYLDYHKSLEELISFARETRELVDGQVLLSSRLERFGHFFRKFPGQSSRTEHFRSLGLLVSDLEEKFLRGLEAGDEHHRDLIRFSY